MCRFCSYLNFYPRSPCGERPRAKAQCEAYAEISIHALLAESDGACRPTGQCASRFLSTLSLRRATPYGAAQTVYRTISIHALLAESDICIVHSVYHPKSFLSTLSLRRATLRDEAYLRGLDDFYPRSPCGERQAAMPCRVFLCRISIHALLAESDFHALLQGHFIVTISIHALLAESDSLRLPLLFNSVISIHALLAESDAALLKRFIR